jgi:predicted RNA-binding Zn ribbon-like protein
MAATEREKARVGRSAGGFEFVGGWAWLDFVNTQLAEKDRVVDLLGDFADLVAWLEEAGLIGRDEAEEAVGRWGEGTEGERLLDQAKRFRGALREAAERLAAGWSVQAPLVGEINALLRERPGHPELVPTEGGFEVRFSADAEGPEALLSPVAESAAGFLAEADPSLVKACENPGCVLFFHDQTKNHRRRWCSMATCGNRAKVRAHYERARNAGGGKDGANLVTNPATHRGN